MIRDRQTLAAKLVMALMLISSMQLVVLQVKATQTVFSSGHHPCHDVGQAESSQLDKENILRSSQRSGLACAHCQDFNNSCYDGCDMSSAPAIPYDVHRALKASDSPQFFTYIQVPVAISSLPLFKPPRLA